MTQGPSSPFDVALAQIRVLFAQHQDAPSVLTHSPELEDRTRDASRAATSVGMPMAGACAEFGRAATESFPADRLVAIAIGRTMTRWAAEVYHRARAVHVAVS